MKRFNLSKAPVGMKKYLSFFKIRFIAGLSYRSAAWAGVFTQFGWGFMTVLMFKAFYESSPESFPILFSSLSSYIWLQQALLAMFMFWFFDGEIFDSITSGGIAYELCRPCGLYAMWFVKNMAARLSNAALRSVPILLVAVFLPKPYGISLPDGILSAVLFLISLILGFLVLIALSMLIYISAIYTLSSAGVRILATSAVEFLSGAIIPIPFFPDGLRAVIELTPFAAMQSTPFLIYSGHIDGDKAVFLIGVQLVWLAALGLFGVFAMSRALKRVTVQGG